MTALDWRGTAAPSPDVSAQQVEDETLILDLARSEYYSLNVVGSAMWELMARGLTLEEVVAEICHRFETTEAQVRQDLAALVGELRQRRLIDVSPSDPSLRADGGERV